MRKWKWGRGRQAGCAKSLKHETCTEGCGANPTGNLTLMTRGMKGCYVYCTDARTRQYLRRHLGEP